ncbi:MAG TPA: hypothetical protein G4O02_00850 [Caldilineae bacterium]|nr:hypothetical protein [Caldilineae bacterium]
MGKIFKTTDGAATWTAIYTPSVKLQSLALTDTLVYAGGWGYPHKSSIYRSVDGGLNWERVYTTTKSWNSVFALAIHPAITSTVYAAGMESANSDPDGVVYRSTDGGANWTRAFTVTGGAFFGALAVNPFTPTILLAGGGSRTGGFIYRSEDGGLRWTKVYTTPPGYYVSSLAFHPLTPTLAYAASSWPGMPSALYRSQDGGRTWSGILTDMAGPFALEPPNTIYVAQAWGKIRKSTDGGDTWTEVSDSPGGAQLLTIDLALVPHVLYLGLFARGIYISTDGGENWSDANNGLELLLIPSVIAVDPKRPSYLYTAGGHPGGFRSTDGGIHWQQLQDVPYLYAFAIHPLTTDVIYAGGDCDRCATIYRSADSGVHWTGLYTSPVIAQGGSQRIAALAIDPLTPTTIYAAGVDWIPGASPEGVILRSTEGGEIGTWTKVYTVTAEWKGFDILAINPLTTSILYAGAQDCSGGYPCIGALYRTTDGGQNWAAVLTSTNLFRSLVVDHWRPNIVYVADERYRVYKSTDGGDSWVIIRHSPQQPGDPPSGHLLAIDPRVPAYLYLAGMGWVGRSSDGGGTWEDLGTGLPRSLNPTALALDSSTVTQTLYLGANGVWSYSQPWPGTILYLPLAVKNCVSQREGDLCPSER